MLHRRTNFQRDGRLLSTECKQTVRPRFQRRHLCTSDAISASAGTYSCHVRMYILLPTYMLRVVPLPPLLKTSISACEDEHNNVRPFLPPTRFVPQNEGRNSREYVTKKSNHCYGFAIGKQTNNYRYRPSRAPKRSADIAVDPRIVVQEGEGVERK